MLVPYAQDLSQLPAWHVCHKLFLPCAAQTGVAKAYVCLLYTSDAADERSSVDLGGRRIIKKKKKNNVYVEQFIYEKQYKMKEMNSDNMRRDQKIGKKNSE